jgi:hypothetical protein
LIREKEKFSKIQKKLGIKGFQDMHINKKNVEDFDNKRTKKRIKIKKKKRKRNQFNAGFLQELDSLKKSSKNESDQVIKNDVDIELDKLLNKRKSKTKKGEQVDRKAYNQNLDEFLTKNENEVFSRPREYKGKKAQTVTLEDMNTHTKGVLISKKKSEKQFGLDILTKGKNDGTKSIVNLKLPSEMLREKVNDNIPDPEDDLKIKEDLKNLPDSVFLTELGEKGDGNQSTFYMLQLLKSRGINKSKSIVSKKERYEKFLDEEKIRKTNDAGDEYYNKMLNGMVMDSKEDALKFDKNKFLRKKRPIIIEYRNKQGQILDKKESFNEMCLKFHGVKRSVTKIERIRKNKEKRQMEQSKTNSFALPSFFKGAKNITNKAYINLTKDLN